MRVIQDGCEFDRRVTRIQVMLWYAAIVAKSGLSKNEIGRLFPSTPRPGGKISGAYSGAESGYWDRISRGEILPLRRQHGRDLVDAVEAAFPGTKRWLVSPIWNLLRTAPVAPQDLLEVYLTLPYQMRKLLLIDPTVSSVFFRRPAGENPFKALGRIAERSLRDEDRAFDRLMGCVVAVLALTREAEIRQIQPQHYRGRVEWEPMVRRLDRFSEIRPFLNDIVQLGRDRFRGTVYCPDGASEVVMASDKLNPMESTLHAIGVPHISGN